MPVKAVGGLWDIRLASKALPCCSVVPVHREILVFLIQVLFLLNVPAGGRPCCTRFTPCAWNLAGGTLPAPCPLLGKPPLPTCCRAGERESLS